MGRVEESVFVPEKTVEALDEGALHRTARFDECLRTTMLIGPLIHRLAPERGLVAARDVPSVAPQARYAVQRSDYALDRQRALDLEEHTLPSRVVHDSETPEPAVIG